MACSDATGDTTCAHPVDSNRVSHGVPVMNQQAKTAIGLARMAAYEVYGNPLDVEPHLMLTNYGHHTTTSDIEQLLITESFWASEVPFWSC